MPPHLVIIADDVTGAMDTGVVFSPLGKVVVATRPEAFEDALAQTPDVLAVSTRSRTTHPDCARRAVAGVLQRVPAGSRVFKRMDSRLRGNIAAELDPFGACPKLVAPAIPEFGRTVVGQFIRGFGVIQQASVPQVLGEHAATALCPDTKTDQDMDKAVAALDPTTLCVGARGLASALARKMAGHAVIRSVLPTAPLLMIVGSTDPVTLGQVAQLATRGDIAITPIVAGRVPALPCLSLVTLLNTTGDAPEPSDIIAQRFAQGCVPWVQAAGTTLVTGGTTAEALIDALNLSTLVITGEVQPGMPMATTTAGPLVTKSGALGDACALVKMAAMTMT